MLIDFTVENFRSFGAEQTFSMVASSKLQDHAEHLIPIPDTGKNVLQASVLYGANASGKSNLVKAIHFAQQLILGKLPLDSLASHQFRFQKHTPSTSFEFRFLVTDQVFVYGFNATPDAILDEWLDVIPASGREVNLFLRTNQHVKVHRSRSTDVARDEKSQKLLKTLESLGVADNQLFLHKIIQQLESHLGDMLTRVVHWFQKSLQVIFPESNFSSLIQGLFSDQSFRDFNSSFLRTCGTGIDALEVELNRIKRHLIPDGPRQALEAGKEINGSDLYVSLDPNSDEADMLELYATHKVKNETYQLPFDAESDGTKRVLNLLPAIWMRSESKVVVIDEIDRSMHPLLCHKFVRFFLKASEGRHQQLIATTHETHLLDQDLLRRDEIWFVEKDEKQQSRLSSLAEWKIRNDIRIEKGYLQGRFGGIPFLGTTQGTLDLLQEDSANGKPHGKKKKAASRPKGRHRP